jgi:hypothetical protein
VGRSLAHRRHRHRVAARPGPPGGEPQRHRLPAGQGQPDAAPPARPRRYRGRIRGPAAAGGGARHAGHHPAQPRAHGEPGGARAHRDRRRQVHDVPGHGPRSHRCGRGRPAGAGPAVADRYAPARRRGRVRRALGGAAAARGGQRPARGPGRAAAGALWLCRGRPDGPDPRAPRTREAGRGRRRLPRGGDRLRMHARGGRAPGRRARPPDPDGDRGPRPRAGGGAARRGADGGRTRLGRGAHQPGGQPVPRPGGRRPGRPVRARRPAGLPGLRQGAGPGPVLRAVMPPAAHGKVPRATRHRRGRLEAGDQR